MSNAEIAYLAEDPVHDNAIEAINAEAFGPGRFARAAYRIREGGPHDRTLSFVAVSDGAVIGSVRQTWVSAVGPEGDINGRALLLGPLAVRPGWKSRGIGRELVKMALGAARKAGAPAVILVGDAPYYGPLGFVRVPAGQVSMPGPVDPQRLLVAEIVEGISEKLVGTVVHADRAVTDAAATGLRDTTSSRAPEAEAPNPENRRTAARD